MDKDTAIQYIYDGKGKPQGVVITPELWNHVCKHVLAALEKLCPQERPIIEPLADLELLEKFWDLRYDLPTDVTCEVCGATTANWKNDDPRKFMLKAANMGGLLSFQCVGCSSRVTKRHFKDKVTVTCTPHLTCACK